MVAKRSAKTKFFSSEYDDLLQLLEAKSSGIVYKALCALAIKQLDERAIEPLKTISESGKTFKNRKLAFTIFTRHFPEQLGKLQVGQSKVLGYVYFIQEKLFNHVKIGRTRNLERRFRLFITNLPFDIELVQFIKTYNYEKIELKLHEFYNAKRVKGEWFKLTDHDIESIRGKKYTDEIGELITETSSDSE
jgi:hypothetical protein